MNKFEEFESSFHAQLEELSRERKLTLDEKITICMRRLYRLGEDFILSNMAEYRSLIRQAGVTDKFLMAKGEDTFLNLSIGIRDRTIEGFTNNAFDVITNQDSRTKIIIAGCEEASSFWQEQMQFPDASYLVRKYGPQRDKYFKKQIAFIKQSFNK